jgi:molybdate transport system substrate-binding protein
VAPGAQATASNTPSTGAITVFAASSLTDAFRKIAVGFRQANPGTSIEFNFGGSPALVTQLDQGASADVLATADQQSMDAARAKGLVRDGGTPFARNRLAIIVPKSNPAHLTTPADLAQPGLKLVLAQKDVPAGNYARQALARLDGAPGYGGGYSAAVLANVVSDEPNVKAVVTKVQLGGADAGIVYVTDVTASVSGDLAMIAVPDAYNVIATYPIAVTKEARRAGVAQAFIDYVLSPAGQAVLEGYGFIPVR